VGRNIRFSRHFKALDEKRGMGDQRFQAQRGIPLRHFNNMRAFSDRPS
jgi:hypothetical protein